MSDDRKIEHDTVPCWDDHNRVGYCNHAYCGCRCHKGVLMMAESED